ncbi:uncharacterized protein [Clytia hemisphaerica]|uniref:uncharacterized protein n=1 Tax=Clytia hemisphaerica TaxID=252671 RepID=UPI0034D77E06
MNTQEIECVYQGFRLGRTLGEGAYGKVRLATYVNLNVPDDALAAKLRSKGTNKVAIKIMPRENKHLIRKEYKAMLRAKTSSNVVEVYTKFDGKKNSYIVMEYCHNGDLSHYLSPAPFVEEQKAKELFKIILKDFGVSEFFGDGLLSSYCGTASYMAPEMIRGYLGDHIRYDGTKSDNWSLGIILFELLTECLHLLGRLLEKDPKQRANLGGSSETSLVDSEKKRDEKVAQNQEVQTAKLVAEEQVTRPSQDVRV